MVRAALSLFLLALPVQAQDDPAAKKAADEFKAKAKESKSLPEKAKLILDLAELKPRDKDAAKASAAPPPPKPRPEGKDGLLFTVRARFDGKGPNRGTSRDRVELTADEWKSFLPKEKAEVGQSWPVPEATITVLLKDGGKRVLEVGGTVGGTDDKQRYARVVDKGRSDVFVLSEADTARFIRDRAVYVPKK